jgi:nitrogen fixation protein NifQ
MVLDPLSEMEEEAAAAPGDCGEERRDHAGLATYRLLMGCDPADTDIADDHDFDRHVFASILAAAAMDGGPIGGAAGLATADMAELVARWFPHAAAMEWTSRAEAEDEEAGMVRDLLTANRSGDASEGRWLAHMVARRALEANHLWEDLGLRNRAELTRLLERHFAPLAARNTRGMRWKRFFYRMMCEDDGFLMCATPVCTDCRDFSDCFGDESGESRLAQRRREMDRKQEEAA